MSLHEDDQVRLANLPFRSAQTKLVSKLDEYADHFNKIDRSFDIQSISRSSGFLARSSAVTVGSTNLFSAVHTSLRYVSTRDEPFATFLLPFLGTATFTLNRRRYRFSAGETALFMPGQARQCETQLAGGTMIKLSRERLAAKAAELAGDHSDRLRFLSSFERPWEFSTAVPIQKHLLSVIRKTVDLIDLVPDNNATLSNRLGIDDLLYRCIVLLTHPELLTP